MSAKHLAHRKPQGIVGTSVASRRSVHVVTGVETGTASCRRWEKRRRAAALQNQSPLNGYGRGTSCALPLNDAQGADARDTAAYPGFIDDLGYGVDVFVSLWRFFGERLLAARHDDYAAFAQLA